jgi:6-phosphofructokinase 1
MKIGVLCSGGDAPGMNAAVRTAAGVGYSRGHTVLGIRNGYQGLLEGRVVELDMASVYGVSRLGGTILGTARSKEFPTEEGQKKARARIKELGLDGLIVIGGNGSLTGAHLLARDRPCTIVGLPASIDNDIGLCGLSIGVDTAVNTIVEACDRILDTARSHKRAFIVEVMGRHSGFLAMRSGISAEADAILYGEQKLSEQQILDRLKEVLRQCFVLSDYKQRALIIKAEGVEVPTAWLVQQLQLHLDKMAPGVEIRETILGHVVRGGRPSAMDRTIAQRVAYAAMLGIEAGAHDIMMSWDVPGGVGKPTADPYVKVVPLEEVLKETGRLMDGTSPVVQARINLLKQVEDLLTL